LLASSTVWNRTSNYSPSPQQRDIEGFLMGYNLATRGPEKISSYENVIESARVSRSPDKYANASNSMIKFHPSEVLKMIADAPDGALFLLAIGQGAWEFIYMYHRSLMGPTLEGILKQLDQYGVLQPLKDLSLPQNNQKDLSERHRILEITQIQYNYTALARFGGFFGQPLLGTPAMFNHVPPSNDLFLMSDAESLHTQLGYDINLVRSAVVSKIAQGLGDFYTKSKFTSLQDYVDAIKFFGVTPPIVQNNLGNLNNWLNDVEFGRQRLQGLNPEMITLVTPDTWKNVYLKKLNWTADVNTKVTQILKGQTITDAIKAKIIYVCDYWVFDSDDLRTLAMGFRRYIAAPIGLFYYDTTTNNMLPLGIQLMPDHPEAPGRNKYQFHLPTQVNGVDTPAWILAKIWLNSVDGQYQELISHLMESHEVGELVSVAAFRNLAVNHPVYQLIHSNFDATIEINTIAYGDLLAYTGPINLTIGSGSIGAAMMIGKLWPDWNFYQRSFKQNLVNRGLLNPDGSVPDKIKGYWWRDDGLKLYNIIYNFIVSVLDAKFYKTDQDVVNDWEIQNFLSELQASRYGNMKNATSDGLLKTRTELYTLLANVIFTVTAKHSAGNAGQFDYYGFTPNVPGALYIPPTINEKTTTWATIFQALPPKSPALNQMAIVYLLSGVQQPNIPMIGNGAYPDKWSAAVVAFQNALGQLSGEIEDREKGKPYPYLYLDPAQVGNSIYI